MRILRFIKVKRLSQDQTSSIIALETPGPQSLQLELPVSYNSCWAGMEEWGQLVSGHQSTPWRQEGSRASADGSPGAHGRWESFPTKWSRPPACSLPPNLIPFHNKWSPWRARHDGVGWDGEWRLLQDFNSAFPLSSRPLKQLFDKWICADNHFCCIT